MTEDELIIEWLSKRRFVVYVPAIPRLRMTLAISMYPSDKHRPVCTKDLDYWAGGSRVIAFGLGLVLFDECPHTDSKTLRDAVREWMVGL